MAGVLGEVMENGRNPKPLLIQGLVLDFESPCFSVNRLASNLGSVATNRRLRNYS